MTPATSAVTAKIIAKVFTLGQLTVVQGGVKAAQSPLALPFDQFFLYGQPAFGQNCEHPSRRTVAGGANGADSGRAFVTALIAALTPEMDISTQEIFGPILPIIPYEDIAKLTASTNARSKPLALYIFARDRQATAQIIAAITSGSVGVNLTMAQFLRLGLPFGR